jgi:hypothetical protein
VSRIADIDDDIDVVFETWHFGGQMHVFAARIPIPVRTG